MMDYDSEVEEPEVVEEEVVEEPEEEQEEEPERPNWEPNENWLLGIPEEQRSAEVKSAIYGIAREVAKARDARKAMEARLAQISDWYSSQVSQQQPQQAQQAPPSALPDPDEDFTGHLLARLSQNEAMLGQLTQLLQGGQETYQANLVAAQLQQATESQALAMRARTPDYDDTIRAGLLGFIDRAQVEYPHLTERELSDYVQDYIWKQRQVAVSSGIDFGEHIYRIAKSHAGAAAGAAVSKAARAGKVAGRHLGGPGGAAPVGRKVNFAKAKPEDIDRALDELKKRHPGKNYWELTRLLEG